MAEKANITSKERFFKQQSLKGTQELLENIVEIQKATARDTRKWYRKPQIWMNVLSGLIVPIGVFVITYRQAELFSRQAQQIQGFDTLLRNTNETNILIAEQLKKIDTQLVISQTMLASSMKASESSDIGNMNRFAAAIYRLGELLTEYKRTASFSENPEQYLATNAKPILESQMNNAYLTQNTAVMKQWVDAYRHACAYMESTFSAQFSDDFGSEGKSRIKEVGKDVKTDFASALRTLNDAFVSGGNYLKGDKRFLK